MTPRTIPGRGGGGSGQRIGSGQPACGYSWHCRPPPGRGGTGGVQSGRSLPLPPSSPASSIPAAAAGSTVKTATIAWATVLTSSQGFTLYSFAPDTSTTSKRNRTCAQNWPPVNGPVTAAGVTGTYGTITRSDGSVWATFDGDPLYTFAGDTAPGRNKGNGLNAAGGLWHEITTMAVR